VPEHGKFPNAMSVWDPGFDAQGEFVPLPALNYHAVDCEECNGTGLFICPTCEHEDDCSDCEASGEVLSPHWLDIGVNIFASKLLDKLVRLPGISIVIPHEVNRPMSFRFDGGEGLLMCGDKQQAIKHGNYVPAAKIAG
jgi:hypothetical protein